ncbi:MAG: hypothetical protein ACLQDY_05520 [Streptosporangiaceae bacterium]
MRIRYLTPLVAVLACAGLSVVPASASTGTWTVQATPAIGGQSGVSCWSSSGCLSVGSTASMKWNGSTWTTVAGIPDGLDSVSCASATYCIAVGATSAGKAEAWLYNGSRWSSQVAYNTPSPDNSLAFVRCASSTSCEAVGSHSSSTFTYPLAEAWNGSKWTDQSTSGAPQGSLTGVACESAAKCQAVGADLVGFTTPDESVTESALAMGLSGSKWVTQPTPILENQYDINYWHDTGISCWSSGCIAVGNEYNGAGDPSSNGDYQYAEKWDGSKWSMLSTPGQGGGSAYGNADWYAVHCQSATSCTAVGTYSYPPVLPYYTLVDSWNGAQWTQVPSPSPGVNTDQETGRDGLSALACTSGGAACTAVGYQMLSGGASAALAERN